MKKGIALLLALAICLSLCACGGTSAQTMTMDEMLAVAEEADAVQIYKDCSDNLARVKESYCGKVVTITGGVKRIGEDYLIIGTPDEYTRFSAVVYLPTEDLISIESRQKITVVGKVDDELTEIEEELEDMSVLNLKNAYLVTDRYEVSGANFGPNFSYYPAINFEVEENHCCLLYLKDEATLAKVGQLGYQEVFTVMGKIQYDSGPVGYDVLDAVLVE